MPVGYEFLRKSILGAKSVDALQTAYEGAVSATRERYAGKYRAAEFIARRTAKFDHLFQVRKDRLTRDAVTGKDSSGGTASGPKTFSDVWDAIAKQGLQLVGLGQQVQSSNAANFPTTSGSKPPDFGKWLLIGGGALVAFYFFKRS